MSQVWTLSRSTGTFRLTDTGQSWTVYSGRGIGLNNPGLERLPNVGPIPRGLWTIKWIGTGEQTGPVTWVLQPDAATETFGRDDFDCHGDNVERDHTASEGCIVAPHDCRILGKVGDQIWAE